MRGGLFRTTVGGHSVWVFGVMTLAMGCGIFGGKSNSDDDDDGGDGGGGQSGASSGGSTSLGGSSSGGTISKGGTGGTSKGGSSNGGSVSNGGSISNGGSVSDGGSVSNGGSISNGGTGALLGGTGGDLSAGGTISNGGSGGGTSGTGGGDPPTGMCGNDVFGVQAGGYVTTPGPLCWHGYAFTVIDTLGSTITPTDFSACASAGCLCVSGTVVGDADYLGYATFGFNLNQEPGLDTTEGTVIPAGSGITISYTNTGGSGLRVQIGNGDTRWCYDNLTGTGGTVTIPYSSFNTECWEGGAGEPYSGAAISSVQLVIPGKTTAVSYSACLVSAQDG